MKRLVLQVLLPSLLLGYLLGAHCYPTFQDAVELAQVVGGVVDYPSPTPFARFQANNPSLVVQLCALILRLGGGERGLSVVVSGFLGAASFAALALATFALSRRPFLSLSLPPLVFLSRASDYGTTYPVSLLGIISTFGIYGPALYLLAIALPGAGAWRLAALLAGLLPALHPALGAFLWGVIALSLAWMKADGAWREFELRRLLAPFGLGACVSAGTFAWQFLMVRGRFAAPTPDPAASELLYAFIRHWDYHRQPVPFLSPGMLLTLLAILLALAWLYRGRSRLAAEPAFFLRLLAMTAVVAVIASLFSHLPPERQPLLLLRLMPQRLMNVALIALVPLIFGLSAVAGDRLAAGIRLLLLGCLLLASGGRLGADGLFWCLALAAIATTALAFRRPAEGRSESGRALVLLETLGLALFLAIAAWHLCSTRGTLRPGERLRDRTNDPFWEEVARGKGVIATAPGLPLAQLLSRRNVLLNVTALDDLPYAPEVGPELNRALKSIYGLDLLQPPPGLLPTGQAPVWPVRTIWEARLASEWSGACRDLGVTGILAPADWEIDLPVTARGLGLTFYAVPDSGAAAR